MTPRYGMSDADKLKSVDRLIRARELVYDDWVAIDDLRAILNGHEPSHVAYQLGETKEP